MHRCINILTFRGGNYVSKNYIQKVEFEQKLSFYTSIKASILYSAPSTLWLAFFMINDDMPNVYLAICIISFMSLAALYKSRLEYHKTLNGINIHNKNHNKNKKHKIIIQQ